VTPKLTENRQSTPERQAYEKLSFFEIRLASSRFVFDISLDPAKGAELNWLHKNTEILRKIVAADGMLHLRIRVGQEEWVERVRRKFFASKRLNASHLEALAKRNSHQQDVSTQAL
jgi:hypothetical protein